MRLRWSVFTHSALCWLEHPLDGTSWTPPAGRHHGRHRQWRWPYASVAAGRGEARLGAPYEAKTLLGATRGSKRGERKERAGRAQEAAGEVSRREGAAAQATAG